jgi:hypothetical protein
MKKISRLSRVHALVGVALCSILFSFALPMGSHSVQVYLDSKLVIDQYIHSKANVPKLTLDPAEKYSQLIVKYNECGRTVTGRAIILKDDNNKVLKKWTFEGESTGYEESMSCSVKDIIALKPREINTMKLYYSSHEFPESQQIAHIVIVDKSTTASK